MALKAFPHIKEPVFYANSTSFIKTKQEEIIRELQKEIEELRHENSGFKFNQCVSLEYQPKLKATDDKEVTRISTQKDARTSKKCNSAIRHIKDNKDIPEGTLSEVKRLEHELEAARNMIEELNWVKVHHENRMQNQELKIEELQREIKVLKSTELELVQLQIPGIISRCSMTPPRSSSKRRSSSLSRRGSTQSVLPNNYKESVATLPPISRTNPA